MTERLENSIKSHSNTQTSKKTKTKGWKMGESDANGFVFVFDCESVQDSIIATERKY